jgi:hypothetical protein
VQFVSPWITEQYCAIFHFVHGLQQINMLSDTGAACVANTADMCLRKRKFTTRPKNGRNKDHKTHTKTYDRLKAE